MSLVSYPLCPSGKKLVLEWDRPDGQLKKEKNQQILCDFIIARVRLSEGV